MDPEEAAVADGKAWRARRPAGRLVLFGAPDGGSAEGWGALRPLIVERRDDFEALRSMLGRALAGT